MDYPNSWLSDLKFARLHPGSDIQPNVQMPLPSFQNPVQDPAQIQNEPQNTYSASSLNDIDKLKQDKPGEEMASDATIWRLYKKEAMEHDSELVEGRNKNLDTMLLFAGLFSAVLTAFLAGSIGMLKQDPADVTVSLLLDIARSQQRLEQGTALNSSSLVDVPPFSPDLYARWINGFWFMALTLSLAAAMVAMLAKEWLSAFTASHMRPPHAYALNRQARLDSLYSWYTLPIIDFLPTLLHVSLLLFMLGLLFNLWLLDHAIAIVIGSAGGIMVLLYMAIIVLGATKKLCPFHTRVSRYLRSLYETFGHNPSKWEEEEEDHTTGEDILALRWLADNARDPSTADSAYQALAGLRNRPIRPISEDDPKALHRDQEAVLTAFTWIQTRLLSLHERYPRQIAVYRGENAARYAGALVALYTGLKQYLLKGNLGSKNLITNMGEGFKKPIEKAASASLDALARMWDDQTPPFSPDAYANLTAAELRLITAVAGELEEKKPSESELENGLVATPLPFEDPAREMDEPPSTIYSEHPEISRGTNNSPNLVSADVTVEVTPQVGSDLPTLFDLRARYSGTLFRASIQLRYHTTGRAMIGNYPLLNLLHSMRDAAVQELLNPGTCLSTHHPQEVNMRSPVFGISVVGTGILHYLSQDMIGDQDGLLAGLVNILGNSSVQSVPEIEIAAYRTLSAIAPKLIQQWLVRSKSPQIKQANGHKDPVLQGHLEHWHLGLEASGVDPPTDPSGLATAVLNQLFLISSFALSELKNGNLHELLEFTWSALYSRANMSTSSRTAAHIVAISYHSDILALMIDSANQKEATALWSLSAKKRLAQFLGIIDPNQNPKATVFYMLTETHSIAKSHILAIMKLLQSTPEISDTASILLADINHGVVKGTSCFYDCFTRTSLGFTGLSEIGKNQPEYAPIVAKMIIQLIITLEKWCKLNDSRRLTAPAVSGFLDAVQFVCRNKPPEWNQTSTDFFRAFINTIKTLGFISHELFYSHDVLNDIKAGLRDLGGESRRRGLLLVLDKLEKGHKRQAKTLVPVFFSKYKYQGVPKCQDSGVEVILDC